MRLSLLLIFIDLIGRAITSEEETTLYNNLFRSYQPLVAPVRDLNVTQSEPLTVTIGLQFVNLLGVDERAQVMQSNVWLTMTVVPEQTIYGLKEWFDYQMQWNPGEYADTAIIRVAPDRVWLPDIVLLNNADGNFEVTFFSNVVVHANGRMLWVPPAVYRSYCIIDVEHFPFDEQHCSMDFGSWTFNKNEVELQPLHGVNRIDLTYYVSSSVWDIVDCPAVLSTTRNHIQYTVIIRRKPLFYSVVLIAPTVSMAILSMMVFYLPTKAGEKITLAISILLALVVVLLLISKILPATSSTIPLIAKYLLLTFVFNVFGIFVTVFVVNVHFRSPLRHKMPRWIKVVFLDYFAWFLCMRRPKRRRKIKKEDLRPLVARAEHQVKHNCHKSALGRPEVHRRVPTIRLFVTNGGNYAANYSSGDEDVEEPEKLPEIVLTKEAMQAIESLDYITEYLRQDEAIQKVRADWMYTSMVIDRILLFVFFGITLAGTTGILLSAPTVFETIDQAEVIKRLRAKYDWESRDAV